jgi:hypothetical protein
MMVRYVAIFDRWQLSPSRAATLAVELLPQQGGAFQFCAALIVPEN